MDDDHVSWIEAEPDEAIAVQATEATDAALVADDDDQLVGDSAAGEDQCEPHRHGRVVVGGIDVVQRGTGETVAQTAVDLGRPEGQRQLGRRGRMYVHSMFYNRRAPQGVKRRNRRAQ